jgi:hypothetical protein
MDSISAKTAHAAAKQIYAVFKLRYISGTLCNLEVHLVALPFFPCNCYFNCAYDMPFSIEGETALLKLRTLPCDRIRCTLLCCNILSSVFFPYSWLWVSELSVTYIVVQKRRLATRMYLLPYMSAWHLAAHKEHNLLAYLAFHLSPSLWGLSHFLQITFTLSPGGFCES